MVQFDLVSCVLLSVAGYVGTLTGIGKMVHHGYQLGGGAKVATKLGNLDQEARAVG